MATQTTPAPVQHTPKVTAIQAVDTTLPPGTVRTPRPGTVIGQFVGMIARKGGATRDGLMTRFGYDKVNLAAALRNARKGYGYTIVETGDTYTLDGDAPKAATGKATRTERNASKARKPKASKAGTVDVPAVPDQAAIDAANVNAEIMDRPAPGNV